MSESGLVVGDDGLPRCWWGSSPEIYVDYHDCEWGVPTVDEQTLFEKLCLEGFQAGLSWLTILRKRDRFRERFCGFDPEVVARFGPAEIDSLLDDAGIIRHRGKIEATIANANALLALHNQGQSLAGLIWSHEDPERDDLHTPGPTGPGDVPATTEASTALSKALKARGFRFVGPTTVYAGLQAMGIVNDHLEHCHRREPCGRARRELDEAVAATVGSGGPGLHKQGRRA